MIQDEPLRSALTERLDHAPMVWLETTAQQVRDDPRAIRAAFPRVSRMVGRRPMAPDADPSDPFCETTDDAARALLLCQLDAESLAAELVGLYRHGDTRERCGVVRALDHLPTDEHWSEAATTLVADALRSNEASLIAAALGPGGVATLDDDAFAQAVLKAVFVGLALDRIHELRARTTPELSRMLADFVHERVAAGRDIDPAVWPLIDAHPAADRIAAIEAEVDSEDPRRAAAAREALARRV